MQLRWQIYKNVDKHIDKQIDTFTCIFEFQTSIRKNFGKSVQTLFFKFSKNNFENSINVFSLFSHLIIN